jgi:hypothetical protein
MQEVWLFGKLDTLGKSEVEERTEDDAKKIMELLLQLSEVKGEDEASKSSSLIV